MFEKIKFSAEQGDIDAQFSLGRMYCHGNGVTKDYVEAIVWFTKSAKQGSPEAQNYLGTLYRTGYERVVEGQSKVTIRSGVKFFPKNYEESVNWFKMSAEQGLDIAQFNLGLMYSEGKGITKNDKEALKWFSKSAKQGFPEAQYNLGVSYAYGVGVPKDCVEAYKWLSLSASRKNTPPMKNLKKLCLKHIRVISKEMAEEQIIKAKDLIQKWE
jgi:uncharacterized protein